MALESGTYVKDLVSTNPPGTDAISQGDDHIRLIKSVLKNSFPSNSNAPIVPDISGNGDKYLQVNTGATATQWVTLDVDALTRRKGELQRAKFERLSDTSIKVYPAIYDLDAKGKNVSWDSALTITGLSGTAEWHYIYLDYSAITGTTVTASEIITSTTAPSWSDSKHGWYNGDDRCIFAVYITSNVIQNFYHDGKDFVQYGEDLEEEPYGTATINSWTDIDIDRNPAFATEIEMTIRMTSPTTLTNACSWSLRTYGDISSGHLLGVTEGGGGTYDDEHVTSNKRQYISSGKVQYLATSISSGHKFALYSNGFFLPRGM